MGFVIAVMGEIRSRIPSFLFGSVVVAQSFYPYMPGSSPVIFFSFFFAVGGRLPSHITRNISTIIRFRMSLMLSSCFKNKFLSFDLLHGQEPTFPSRAQVDPFETTILPQDTCRTPIRS